MTESDIERIHAEMGEHGDTRTTNPRLVCRACESFVYVTHPRGFKDGAVTAECDCRVFDPTRDNVPDPWTRINQYVASEGEQR